MSQSLMDQHFFGFNDLVIKGTFFGPGGMITPEGGYAVRVTNKTGVATVKGKLAECSESVDNAVALAGAGDTECVGVFYDAGVADGDECWIVWGGIADVLLDDDVSAVHGNWMATGAAEGYARTATSPAASPQHFQEIGHCLESVSATGGGTHILAKCMIHLL